MRVLLACLALATLSGCTMPSEPDAPVDASTYTIRLDGAPQSVGPGAAFTFKVHVEGTVESRSPHVGAHVGENSTTQPTTTAYPTKCIHQEGEAELPGTFSVTCTGPAAPGTYYLRGHAQAVVGNATVNWWSAEHRFVVM